MKTTYLKALVLSCSLSVLLVLAGCNGRPRVKHTRTIRLSSAFEPGSAFGAETYNGAISVTGAEVSDCNLVATIVARALTAEEARELAEKVEVTLAPSVGKLEVKIDKPDTVREQSVAVSLDATIPGKANLHLVTHNGAVKTAAITGNIDGKTYNGSITAKDTVGRLKLETHNGKIECSEISGATFANTYNGAVEVSFVKTAPSPANISLSTHNGAIELNAPANLSAKIAVSTHNGSIKSDLAIIGEIGKTKLQGMIGTGNGKIELTTYNGSIRIR